MATDNGKPGIACPKCGCRDLRVRHTRKLPGDRIRRYRSCRHCGRHITTVEILPKDLKPGQFYR